jgi:hypothetical protein
MTELRASGTRCVTDGCLKFAAALSYHCPTHRYRNSYTGSSNQLPITAFEVKPYLTRAAKLLYKVHKTAGHAAALTFAHDVLHYTPTMQYSWCRLAAEGMRIARERGGTVNDVLLQAMAMYLFINENPHRCGKTSQHEDRLMGRYLFSVLSKRIKRRHWMPRTCGLIGEQVRTTLGLFCLSAAQYESQQIQKRKNMQAQLCDLKGAE